MNKLPSLLQIFHPKLRPPIYLGLFLTLLIALLCGNYIIFAQPELPIFYTLADPENILQPKMRLILLPALSMIISLITMIVVHLMSSLESSLLRLYAWASLASQIVLLMSAVRIILIT